VDQAEIQRRLAYGQPSIDRVVGASGSVSVGLLADLPHLVAPVGRMRWAEWGHAPEPEDLSWWIETTGREAGRADLPVTFVAVDERGEAIGAVGLGRFDIEERRDRSPWVLGMIVRSDRRGTGVGRRLMSRLERFAADRGHTQVWVATGPAAAFYERCGWSVTERLRLTTGQPATVLRKSVGLL
jgi:GNAT superfamily N-acetyltransferase